RATPAPAHVLHLLHQPPYLDARRPSRGMDSGQTAERIHLDPRVLAEDPDAGLADRPPEARLCRCVVVVGLTFLGRELVGLEQPDLPAREQPLELAGLVGVARGEARPQSVHRTAATCSTSAMRATRRGTCMSRGSRM